MRPRSARGLLLAVVGIASLSLLSLAGDPDFGVSAGPRSEVPAGLRADWPEPITPLSPAGGARAELVAFGARLFSDRRLSAGASLSCASCHRLDAGGRDGRRRGVGINGEELLFNIPSILNAWKNYRYNWRGNFATLEEQNEAILLDPHVMGSAWPSIDRQLFRVPSVVGRI
jgi:cytochrome c peroxidase